MSGPARAGYGAALLVLAALAAGLVLGVLAAGSDAPAVAALVRWCGVVGTLFVNAIRMTVVPLVVAMLLSGIAAVGRGAALTRLGVRTAVLGLGLAIGLCALTMAVTLPLVHRIAIAPAAAATLRATANVAGPLPPATGFVQWLGDLVPANPVKALSDGAMLPLIVFTLCFGVALTRLPSGKGEPAIRFFAALRSAMLVLVTWVIRLAPLGVFALAVPLAARMGTGVAGALVAYVAITVSLTLAALALVVYPAVVFGGRIGLRSFARASAPAQAVALSSRSTMASVPAMIEAVRQLGIPDPAAAFVVPLAAVTLRVGAAVQQTVAVLFAARLFDLALGPSQLVVILLTTALTTFAVPGVPGGSMVAMVPVLSSAGIPAGAIAILLGVDAIPDMVRTMANVTGGIAAAAIVGRDASLAAAPAQPYTP